jgi:hypothetical protein
MALSSVYAKKTHWLASPYGGQGRRTQVAHQESVDDADHHA